VARSNNSDRTGQDRFASKSFKVLNPFDKSLFPNTVAHKNMRSDSTAKTEKLTIKPRGLVWSVVFKGSS
jgi:hypothetical protein